MPTTLTPEQRRHMNEIVRPLAEDLQRLVVNLNANVPEMDRHLPTIENNNEILDDGRAEEGIPQPTGAQVHALASIRDQVLALDTPETRQLLAMFAVRPPRVR